MIFIADISSVGIQHEQFNASFIHLLQQENPTEPITFFADSTHIEFQKNKLDNIQFEEINIYDRRGGLKEFIRAYLQFKSLKTIIRQLEAKNERHLFVLLIHPFAHFLFKNFCKSNVRTTLVMHGELESLKFNKHFLNKIWGWFLKQAMQIHKTKVSYIILGESIYQNLIKVLPDFTGQTSVVIDHPYPFTDKAEKEITSQRIVFSSIGVATIHKYTQYLFEVAEQVMKTDFKNNCKFNICGRVYRDMEGHLNNYVHYKQDFGYYTREELDGLLDESSFAVFYYSNANYSLCASGAFWDAVNAELPFLYVHNDYFDYYSNAVGGIGMVFDTPAELNEYILKVARYGIDTEDYKRFRSNIKKLKLPNNELFTNKNRFDKLLNNDI
ncbi:hypothetical protein [Dyadobacter bucti]|uniref:hypothetical protein n=1 Tax=Dyadobacter bucti TaxID=2572203 RepID=UPI003F6EB395